jgi:hypothetical protein
MRNSLQNSLSAIDTVDQIRLSLSSDSGKGVVYILVEGPDDCKIYPKFFAKNKASVEYVIGGKGQLLAALTELNKITKQIIAVCDADFNHLQNTPPGFDNLFFTDFHDIEMTMLFVDGVMNDALTEYGFRHDSPAILNRALEEAKTIGYIRWYNEVDRIKLDFEGMGLGGFFMPHDTNAHLDVGAYLNALNKRSKNKTKAITFAEVSDYMTARNTGDLFNLCSGHDVTAIIALIIGSAASHERFCAILRASFNVNYFRKTKLYAGILKWQTDNSLAIFNNNT